MSGNSVKGRALLLEIYDTNTSTFKVVGGLSTKDLTRDNPVTTTTNQATTGNEEESCYNGYSTVSMSGNGTVDTRDSATIAAYKYLSTIANSATPVARFRLADALETYDGDFNITSFGKSAEQSGLVNFTISLQNAGEITYT